MHRCPIDRDSGKTSRGTIPISTQASTITDTNLNALLAYLDSWGLRSVVINFYHTWDRTTGTGMLDCEETEREVGSGRKIFVRTDSGFGGSKR